MPYKCTWDPHRKSNIARQRLNTKEGYHFLILKITKNISSQTTCSQFSTITRGTEEKGLNLTPSAPCSLHRIPLVFLAFFLQPLFPPISPASPPLRIPIYRSFFPCLFYSSHPLFPRAPTPFPMSLIFISQKEISDRIRLFIPDTGSAGKC